MQYSVLETLASEPVTVEMVRERLRLLPLANYGMKMTDADDRDYFEHFPWYKGKNDNVDNMLTQIEKDNIALIEKLEQEAEKAEAEKAEAEKAEAEKAKADAEK